MTILQADTRDVSDDWESALAAKDSHPVFAVIAILALMVVVGIAAGRIDTAKGIPYVLGATVGPALVLWGIGYAVTIRHANIVWQLGTLGIVLLAAALYFIAVMGTASHAAKRDIGMLAETQLDAQGFVILPPDPDRGPASRVFIDHFAALNAILRQRQRLLLDSGIQRIAEPRAIAREPALLRDCARFDRAQDESDLAVQRLTALVAALPGKLERAGIEPVVRQQLIAGMSAGMNGSRLKARAAGARLNAMFEEAGAICTVLARRQWIARGDAFVFTNGDDLLSYDRHIVALNDLIREDQMAEVDMRRVNDRDRARIEAATR